MATHECKRKACKAAREELAATKAALLKARMRLGPMEALAAAGLSLDASEADGNASSEALRKFVAIHQAHDARDAHQRAMRHDAEVRKADREAQAKRAEAKAEKAKK